MRLFKLIPAIACLLVAAASAEDRTAVTDIVDSTIRRVMQAHDIPGMAVAVTVGGTRHTYYYGIASRESRQPVTSDTLFELGSISKTFTATLAAYAQADGHLSLSESTGTILPALQGSRFGDVGLFHLGTHTAGDFPLQVPDHIVGNDQLMHYLKDWQPDHPPGTHRTYSNLGIGVLGMAAAASMRTSFDDAMEKTLFPALGMKNSYLHVPAARMKDYAQGYTRKDVPIRLRPGMLWAEAYGVKSSAEDMIGFIEANMRLAKLDGKLQRAIDDTHKEYFQSGDLRQGLIWEKYPYPTTLARLLAGNSDKMIYQAMPATSLNPPSSPQPDVLINKTGSTNGFAAYVSFVPARKTGIVLLANKNYPIEARVTAAYEILESLGKVPAR